MFLFLFFNYSIRFQFFFFFLIFLYIFDVFFVFNLLFFHYFIHFQFLRWRRGNAKCHSKKRNIIPRSPLTEWQFFFIEKLCPIRRVTCFASNCKPIYVRNSWSICFTLWKFQLSKKWKNYLYFSEKNKNEIDQLNLPSIHGVCKCWSHFDVFVIVNVLCAVVPITFHLWTKQNNMIYMTIFFRN